MTDPEIRKRKTFTLRLTRFELLHLRDVFSVLLPPEMKVTISQALGASQERVLVEAKLWQKVATACRDAELPMDEEAPDFTVAVSSTPSIGVFELAHDPATPAEEQAEATPGSVFPDGDDDPTEDDQ